MVFVFLTTDTMSSLVIADNLIISASKRCHALSLDYELHNNIF